MVRTLIGIAVALGLALVASTPHAAQKTSQYVGTKKCRTCHKKELIGNQYGWWKEDKHAKAFESLASDKALEYAREKGIQGPPQEADECLECHVTGHGVDPSLVKYELPQKDGVQCESCHGPGSLYRKKKVMSDHDRAIEKGLIEQSEEVCLTCHNDKSPAWDVEKYALADGSRAGFDFEQAKAKIAHPIPEDVKGKYIELEKKLRAEKKARGEVDDEELEE